MTVMREGEKTTVDTDRPPLGRTFAMSVVTAGYGAMTAGLAYFLLAIALPGADASEDLAAVVAMFIAITAVVGTIGIVSLLSSGARQRSWFWLVAVVPGLLILLQNAPFIAYDIIRPANTRNFLLSIVVLAGGLAIIVGGVTAFLEVRRSRVSWTRSGRGGWVSLAIVGALLGAAATSALAGSASAGGTGVAEEPTVSGVLNVEENAFLEARLDMNSGEVLGLFIVNKDPFPHSFDIISLDIHVQLPASSTTAVAIEPTGPGDLEFFCGVPGHREAGMVGTIEVDA